MIKNKEITVRGAEYNDINGTLQVKNLTCICTNDSKGKTLSIDNGIIQFSIPMEEIIKYFR
jgi:hypothetical protein